MWRPTLVASGAKLDALVRSVIFIDFPKSGKPACTHTISFRKGWWLVEALQAEVSKQMRLAG